MPLVLLDFKLVFCVMLSCIKICNFPLKNIMHASETNTIMHDSIGDDSSHRFIHLAFIIIVSTLEY